MPGRQGTCAVFFHALECVECPLQSRFLFFFLETFISVRSILLATFHLWARCYGRKSGSVKLQDCRRRCWQIWQIIPISGHFFGCFFRACSLWACNFHIFSDINLNIAPLTKTNGLIPSIFIYSLLNKRNKSSCQVDIFANTCFCSLTNFAFKSL